MDGKKLIADFNDDEDLIFNHEFVEEMNEIKKETPISFTEYNDLFDDELESIIGIAQEDYTDDVVQLKKDSRRF